MQSTHLLAALLALVAFGAVGVSGASTVTVTAGDPRFDDLAKKVDAEIRRLVEPAEIPADEAKAITVWVADRPSETPASTGTTIWVDPIGLGTVDAAGPDHRLVGALPFEVALERDWTMLRQLASGLGGDAERTVVVPLGPFLLAADSRAEAKIQSVAEKIGLNVEVVEGGPEGDGRRRLLAAAQPGDWIYLPPGSTWDARVLAPELVEQGVLSFSGRGSEDVGQGVLAARSGPRQHRLARLAALEVLAVLRDLPDGDPETVEPRESRSVERPAIHLGTAAGLGLELPWRWKLSAERFGTESSASGTESSASGRVSTLAGVRARALEANLDLRARHLVTAAGAQELEIALAALRPQVGLTAGARTIDRASAEASFGGRPERLATATGEASWILFSEEARAVVDVNRRLQAARELELRQLSLDIELEAGWLLLSVARGRAVEAVREESLALTLSRLDEAVRRRERGAVGKADVARLEAKAARDQRALVAAYGDRRALELGLNRFLNLPLGTEIVPEIFEAERGELPLRETVGRPAELDRLGATVLAKARLRAPETAAAREVAEARGRSLVAARRAFYLPTVRLQGQWSTRLHEGGVGTEPPPLPPGFGAFPETPTDSWSFGLGLELPLYTGGARAARRAEAELQLEAARVLERRAEQRVEERVRLALLRLEVAYEAAFQAEIAAEAAERALEVVAEGYSRGSESLTTFLDAQTELSAARLEHAAARVDALGEWLQLQRSSGAYFSPSELQALEKSSANPSQALDPQFPVKWTGSTELKETS